MSKEVQEENLTGFNWEDDGNNFFEAAEVVPKEKEEEGGEETAEEKTTREKLEEEAKEKANAFFEETEEEGEEEVEEEEGEETPSVPDTYWNDVYKDFKQNGLLNHVEVEEGEQLTSDRIFEIQQEEYEAEVSGRLDTWANELDADAKEFIKFKRNGGNTQDFFKTYSGSLNIPQGDLGDEDYEDSVIRYQLKKEGWDSEEIEDRLEYLTSSGKKGKVAARYNKKIEAVNKAERENTLQKAKDFKKSQKEQEVGFRESIKSALTEVKEVNGVTITKKDKTQLYAFLTKKQHKVSDKVSVTGFQKRLSETFQDPEKMILLAKLINNDFDLSDLKKKTVTQTTRKIKSNLEQRRSLKPANSGSSLAGGALADLFN